MTEVLIFGAGRYMQKLLGCIKQNVRIAAITDNDCSKWNTLINGIRVIPPKEIGGERFDFILIAAPKSEEIKKQLFRLQISEEKIAAPFDYDHSVYDNWRDYLNIEELLYLEMEEKIRALTIHMQNMEYEIISKYKRKKYTFPKIADAESAIYEIVHHGKSMSRYGDGEFDIMLGRKNSFQKNDRLLARRLKEILKSNEENHIVCIPDAYGDFEGRTRQFVDCFRNHLSGGGREEEYGMLDMEKQYYDAFITRPYKDYTDKSKAEEKFEHLKRIWDGRDITIVEGEKTRMGVGNDLYDNVKSRIRILCPCTDAFDRYEEILQTVKETEKDRLVLIALGATATVLAYDLAKWGYQALDIGHIDIEYEWFLRGAEEKMKIPGKYVNEAPGGNDVSDEEIDAAYYEEIMAVIQ